MVNELEIELTPNSIIVEKTSNQELNQAALDALLPLVSEADRAKLEHFMKSGSLTQTVFGRNFCG